MVVELLGTPGCGKSTYVKKIIATNNAVAPLEKYLYRKTRISQNFNKIRLTRYALIHHSAKSRKYYKIFTKIKFKSFSKKVKMFLYLYSVLGAQWRGISFYPDQNIILDEGVNQVIWGFLYNEKNSKDIVWQLHELLVLEMGDKIIHCSVSREVLFDRLMKRNTNGGSELEHEVKDNRAALDKAYIYINEIIEKLRIYGLKERIYNYSGQDEVITNENNIFD